MFKRNTETDIRIRYKAYELWKKAQSKELGTRSERIAEGLILPNPHGYEVTNELDD